MSATYALPDEPRPSGLARFSVNPVWPLFAMMFAGAWLALPWFAFNAWAFGSASRVRETGIAVGGLVALPLSLFGMFVAIGGLDLPPWSFSYLFMLITVEKLAFAYGLYVVQSRSFAIYDYYEGPHVNGLPIVILGAVLAKPQLDAIIEASPYFLAFT